MRPGLDWTVYDPQPYSLHNEPQFAIQLPGGYSLKMARSLLLLLF
jgi:hypothetical protein